MYRDEIQCVQLKSKVQKLCIQCTFIVFFQNTVYLELCAIFSEGGDIGLFIKRVPKAL